MKTVSAFVRSARAGAAIEFALVLPVMLLFMGGILEFGRAFSAYNAVNRLASRYAAAWADCSDSPTGTCQTEIALYASPSSMTNLAPQLVNAIQLRMIEVSMAGTNPTVIYASPAGATLTSSELANAQSVIGSGQIGVVVTVSYTHTLVYLGSLMGPFLGPSRAISYTIAQLKS